MLGRPSIVVFDIAEFVLAVNTSYTFSETWFQSSTWMFVNSYESDGDKKLSSIQLFIEWFERYHGNKIKIDSQIYFLNGNATHVSLLEMYRICQELPLRIRPLISFQDGEEEYLESTMIWSRRNNLHGCSLKVAFVDQFPIISRAMSDSELINQPVYHVYEAGNTTMYGGLMDHVEIIKQLSSDLNFTTTWIQTKDKSYGVFNKKTRKWDGLIHLIMTDEADLSNAYLTVTPSRSEVISFTFGFDRTRYGLFMKKPNREPKWDTFINVLNPQYWVALSAIFVGLSSFLKDVNSSNKKVFWF